MAGVTTSVLGLGLGAYKAIDGAKRTDDAEDAARNYDRVDLTNAYKEMPISTFGSDLLREENARTSANLVDALRMGGSRSILGGIPKVVGATNMINQEAAKMIDGQVINRNYAVAGDDIRIQQMREARDNANLAALSSQANAGRQDMMDGMMGVADSISYGARNIDFGNGSWNDKQAAKMAGLYSGGFGFPTPYSLPRPAGPSQTAQPYFDFSNPYS